jgi:hypothetical protein
VPYQAPLPSSQEKRRHIRVEFHVPVKISGDQGEILTETKNLSCSGAYCRMTQRLEPMTKLKVHLFLPLRNKDKVSTKSITCESIVVRTQAVAGEQYYDTAIFFSDIAPKDSRTINEFVESMLEKQTYGKLN